jgi:hypothetical protein
MWPWERPRLRRHSLAIRSTTLAASSTTPERSREGYLATARSRSVFMEDRPYDLLYQGIPTRVSARQGRWTEVLYGCPPPQGGGRTKEHVNRTLQTRRNEEGRKNLNEKKSPLSLYIRIPFSFLPPVCVHGRSFLLSPFLLSGDDRYPIGTCALSVDLRPGTTRTTSSSTAVKVLTKRSNSI